MRDPHRRGNADPIPSTLVRYSGWLGDLDSGMKAGPSFCRRPGALTAIEIGVDLGVAGSGFAVCGRPRWNREPLKVSYWRRGSESNRRIKVLQTLALPLGYRASLLRDNAVEHSKSIEPFASQNRANGNGVAIAGSSSFRQILGIHTSFAFTCLVFAKGSRQNRLAFAPAAGGVGSSRSAGIGGATPTSPARAQARPLFRFVT